MTASVVVVGGGYGGVTAARALDDVADVVLIEPRDTFVHNVAALRGLVDPRWTDRLFLPYHRLLARGTVRRDRAVRVDGHGVTLGSGDRLEPDYLVLATGSAYPFPAKFGTDDSAAATARILATHEMLANSASVLLLGAGAVGLELAGEIKAVWPDKRVTIVDPAPDILSGAYSGEFRAEVRRQLENLGAGLVLGTSLRDEPPADPGEAKTFTATTRSGAKITADIWFRCFGVDPVSGYLSGEPASARRNDGHVEVTRDLRLPGQERVFAIGDLTGLPEAKTAKAAGEHAQAVATTIRNLIEGGEPVGYEPGEPAIALPLGPSGGATYTAELGVLGAEQTALVKGADLRVDSALELLGLKG
jgi:NADH dehydrogenase FAD-containing subunit